jgi:serine O-acetyltransferase
VDIYPSAEIGKDLRMYHSMEIVIGQKVRVGDRVTILQGVTLGTAHLLEQYTHEDMPTIGNDVVLETGCKVLGGVTVGEGAVIGANAVVVSDIPPHSTAVGIPARVLAKDSGTKT